jgi:metal-responsive CopG/Arc/MetJ family transcriptional regulator
MPNQLHPDKQRVSYAEDREVLEKIDQIAAERGLSRTDIIRLAVTRYLAATASKKKIRARSIMEGSIY